MLNRWRTGWVGVAGFIAGLVVAESALGAGDLAWKRSYRVAEGRMSSGFPSHIQVTMLADPSVPSVPIHYSLVREGVRYADVDTLIPTARRSRETVFAVRLPGVSPGTYTLGLHADPGETIEEKDEVNNQIAFSLTVPNGAPISFRCEGPEASVWEIQRIELNTASGVPYPDENGTRPDTTRSTDRQITVGGIEPGTYQGILFGPSVNRAPILISSGTFTMRTPPGPMDVVWPRSTPYMTTRPKIRGLLAGETVGGESAAPLWEGNTQFLLEATIRNPTDRSADIQWTLRFLTKDRAESAVKDTTLVIGALGTEHVGLTGRVPQVPGNFLVQAEVRVPWPTGFEDIGTEERVASHILPLGWIEVQR